MPEDAIPDTPTPPIPDGRLLRTMQVAKLLQVDRRTLKRWTDEGLIPAFQVGAVRRYDPAEIRAFLAAHRRAETPTTSNGAPTPRAAAKAVAAAPYEW